MLDIYIILNSVEIFSCYNAGAVRSVFMVILSQVLKSYDHVIFYSKTLQMRTEIVLFLRVAKKCHGLHMYAFNILCTV